MKKILPVLLVLLFALLISPGSSHLGNAQSESPLEATYTLGEGVDFATRGLSDPWDMSNFSDISQWLNADSDKLGNIQVSNGVFSARTLADYSEFFPLFPGYEPGTLSGKIGALHPIDSSKFSCFYMAMDATWSTADLNFFILFWAPDRDVHKWINPTEVWGTAGGNRIIKDQWTLYKVALKNNPYVTNKPWTYQQYWQAFRVQPSLFANTQFYVDWIRLTTCQPVYANLSGLPHGQGSYKIWLVTGVPDQGPILVADSVSPSASGTYDWDVQGLPAGSYTYYVKPAAGGNPVQTGTLNIIGSPVVAFTSPSPYSGQDYANHQGNPWDMEPSDVTRFDCVSGVFNNGILALDTASRACAGPGANEADPKVYLNTLDKGDLSSFRYLSFSSRTDGAYSVPQRGMIVRLIWWLSRTGLPDCYYVSRGIPLDVGWTITTVDLYDAWNGTPEQIAGKNCPLVSWRDQASVGPVVGFRIDPNENITGSVMHQEFDWIRVTKVEQVIRGQAARVRVLLNKPPASVNLQFYYTNTLDEPLQSPAGTYSLAGMNAVGHNYLPLMFSFDPFYDPFVDQIPAHVTYMWNTSGVAAGTYYICANASDGYNQAAYCSQAPIQVVNP